MPAEAHIPTSKEKLFGFLKLIRFQNLVMIGLTQYLMRYLILQKVLNAYGMELELDRGLFFALVLSTMFIAAGGYIINDYFDVKTDQINHPKTVVVGTVIKRRWAIILHFVFTTLGILLGCYAAWYTGYFRLAFFHVVASLLLWFYSTHFKRQLLTGNLTVSLLTAAITFIPFVYEMGVMQKVHPHFLIEYRHAVLSSLRYAWIYAVFAFVTTLAREIVKDLEDYEGDLATGCRTMPIVWGKRAARLSAFFLLVITALLLLFVVYNTMRWRHIFISTGTLYIIFLLVLPLVFLSLYLFRAHTSRHYGIASRVLKVIMLAGLGYSYIFFIS